MGLKGQPIQGPFQLILLDAQSVQQAHFHHQVALEVPSHFALLPVIQQKVHASLVKVGPVLG